VLELLAGSGLAVAAGLNAYIPLLALGLAGRFIPGVELPQGWAWLENGWVLAILVVLLVVELVADKIPAVDSVNDLIQTVVRPVSGGIAFGTGSATTTAVVTDPAAFFSSRAWVPVVLGVLLALATHGVKATTRPLVNTATVGTGGPVLSVLEDLSSLALSVLAILVPVLVILALAGLVWLVVATRNRLRRRQGRFDGLGRDRV
jgi:uncharacterized membrane protein